MDSQQPEQQPEQPPQPPQDYASRFRAPGSEPDGPPAGTPAKTAAPPPADPKPYAFAGLLEAALIAPARPWAAFAEAAARPQPSVGALAGVTAVYAAAFFAMNLVHAAIAYPGALDAYPPARFAAVGAVALIVAVLASFAGAGAFHALALVCGGRGSFARSYQAAAMAAALLPAQAAALWWPPAAVLPVLLAALLAAGALEGLHGVKPAAARVSCAALAALLLVSAFAVKQKVDAALAPYLALRQSLAAASATAPGAAAVDPAAAAALQQAAAALQTAASAAQASQAQGSPAPQSPSGLDLVAGPFSGGGLPLPSVAGGQDGGSGSGLGAPPTMPAMPAMPTTPQQMQQLNQASAAMMGSVAPMLQGAMANTKDPRQRAQMQQLAAMISQLQGAMQGNRPLTAADRRKLESQFQGLARQMNQYAPQIRKDAAGDSKEK